MKIELEIDLANVFIAQGNNKIDQCCHRIFPSLLFLSMGILFCCG